ncbi:hypothetical protein B0H14DRAFT_2650060 [Mycena olivaceomarginata]|nr:hypothetical protein B0H14DRAFT_2650060 [Mycena olivaceomarginata]
MSISRESKSKVNRDHAADRTRVTGVEYENRQNVTKSLKIAQKSKFRLTRGINSAIPRNFGLHGCAPPWHSHKLPLLTAIGAHWGVQCKIFLALSDESTKILGMSRSPEAKYEN